VGQILILSDEALKKPEGGISHSPNNFMLILPHDKGRRTDNPSKPSFSVHLKRTKQKERRKIPALATAGHHIRYYDTDRRMRKNILNLARFSSLPAHAYLPASPQALMLGW
jgi:hypothetical protein